jgi:hypothetical protein
MEALSVLVMVVLLRQSVAPSSTVIGDTMGRPSRPGDGSSVVAMSTSSVGSSQPHRSLVAAPS